jgi:hypothetical protein
MSRFRAASQEARLAGVVTMSLNRKSAWILSGTLLITAASTVAGCASMPLADSRSAKKAGPSQEIDGSINSSALREAASEKEVDLEFAAAQIATGNFPRIAEIFEGGRIEIGKDRFQVGLRLLLEEYDRRRSSSRRQESRE